MAHTFWTRKFLAVQWDPPGKRHVFELHFFTFGQTMFRFFGCIYPIRSILFYSHYFQSNYKYYKYSHCHHSHDFPIFCYLCIPIVSYNVNFGQKMMASMIQAIQASKSSESSLASLRTFLLLIEINMLGTNLETGSHIYPWLWSNHCRWFSTPKLYVQNHQIHQKKRVLQKRLLIQRWHPSASLRPNLTFLLRKNLPGEI